MKYEARTNTSSGATYICDNKGQVTIKGTATAYIGLGYNLSTSYLSLSAGTYKLKVIGKATGVNFARNNVALTLDSNQEATITIDTDTNNFQIVQNINAGTYDCDYYITLTPGTTATTERYTGGEPAPNPIYPFPIKNTGDNGSVNEKVQNKNLFDKDNANILNAYFSDNIITSNSANRMLYLKCKPNTAYTITKAKTNYFVIGCTSKIPEIGDTVINKQTGTQGNYDGTTVSQTYTTDSTAQYLVCRFYQTSMDRAISLEDVLASIQVEQGSTATSYQAHSEQNISFPLAQGQKLMEGDYLANDGVHHKMREVVLDGTENWSSWNFTSDTYIGATLDNVIPYDYSSGSDIRGLCNYFEVVVGGNNTKQNIGLRQSNDYSRIYLCIQKSILSSENLAGIKAWLNNNKPVLQYELAEEQTENFTSEQQTAWEQIKKARTYKNITHISSEDETPANVDITYVRDLETVINNLSN